MTYELAKALKDAGFPKSDYPMIQLFMSTLVGKGTTNDLVPNDYKPHPEHCIGHGQTGAVCCRECLCLWESEKYWNCARNLTCKCHREESVSYFPSLPALIEALPTFYDFRLGYSCTTGPSQDKKWEANGYYKDFSNYNVPEGPHGVTHHGEGPTPEIAVANLWLKLNETKNA